LHKNSPIEGFGISIQVETLLFTDELRIDANSASKGSFLKKVLT